MNIPKHIDIDKMKEEFYQEKDNKLDKEIILLTNMLLLKLLKRVKAKQLEQNNLGEKN